MVIGGRYGIAVSSIVLVGFVSVSFAMKVVPVASTESSKDSSKDGKEAKAPQVDTKTAQAVDEKKQAKAKKDEELMFKRTVALYQAIFACKVNKVRRLLKWPIYINGTKTLWNWTCCDGLLYYLSDPALPVQGKREWLLVTTPLNLAIKCALVYYDPALTEQCEPFNNYYQICVVLAQQVGVQLNTFIAIGDVVYATPLHLAMQEYAWPIVKLLLDHGAKPDELNYDGTTAFSDKKAVEAYCHWKASHSRQKSRA